MENIIAYIPSFVLFVFYFTVFVLHAAYVKLSAKIMHGSIVSWKAVFLFSLVMTLATLTGKAISLGTSVTVTANMAFLLSFAINVVFGGWYFAVRAFTRQGHPLGWAGAVQVSALAFVFLAITGILFGSIFHVLSS